MIKDLFMPTITGTSAMTLFSYLVSEKTNKDFKEPVLLARILMKANIDLNNKQSKVAGMTAHYIVGLIFVAIYVYLWKNAIVKPGLLSSIGLGTASGLCGIAAWELTLQFSPDAPVKNKSRFFGHLILAHVIFGIFACFSYQQGNKVKTTGKYHKELN